MTDDFYKKAFDVAVKELSTLTKEYEDLLKEEEILELRMDKLRSGAISLAALANLDFKKIHEDYPDLFDGQTNPQIGITDAVREALRSSDKMLQVGEIRDIVYKISPAVAGHKSPMASIHAVLRRLMDNNQIVVGTDKTSKTTYGWIDCDDWEQRIERWLGNSAEAIAKIKAKGKKKG